MPAARNGGAYWCSPPSPASAGANDGARHASTSIPGQTPAPPLLHRQGQRPASLYGERSEHRRLCHDAAATGVFVESNGGANHVGCESAAPNALPWIFPMTCKTFLAAIIAAFLFGLAAAPAISAPRRHAVRQRPQPQERIACTVLGCQPVPPGCGSTYGRTLGGTPTGFDVVVCPPGIAPFR